MLITYTIQGVPDAGSAIAVATRRAQADGATHVSISGVRQVGRGWEVTVFADLSSPAITRRRGYVENRLGQHLCGPGCPCSA
jgi:hypothetical protein